MNLIIHVHRSGSTDPDVIEIAEEILVEELLRQVLSDQHEQFDLFSEGRTEPHHRHHRAHEAGIKHGSHLYCRPKGHELRIHIDQKPYESPNPTTGAELYRLGHVQPGMSLYREVRGDREDPTIKDGPEHVHLTPDEHFHSGAPSTITIIVEGTPYEWSKPSITYAEVVTLFDPEYPKHPEVTYSVRYKHGPSRNSEGILSPGASVEVKNRMVFNVSRTGQS